MADEAVFIADGAVLAAGGAGPAADELVLQLKKLSL
jgi:hypothetical protein